ncbi:hypothetical protein BDM02DRAFT_3121046 [Thelephora ganbajun]|uniref:Uncharacterized protein n=1 Tax=Thelephora ganbajun TaxID=370292 RepID=A0ACB6Z608_THEGA|nr:hypothetical protein BDM02DRAFT_3121046 [Thelephora ganbajun]
MFLLAHFWIIVASTVISLVILGLAGADKGQASYYLMLLTPVFTIIHHTVIVFLPTYRPSHLEFDASPKGTTFSKPITPPTHTGHVYLAFLILISALWSTSVMTTFYVVGLNVANEVKGIARYTGPAECAFGVVETGISWAIFVMCMNQRIFRYDGVPPT